MNHRKYIKNLNVSSVEGVNVNGVDFFCSFAIMYLAKNTRSIFGYGGF